VLLVEVDDTCLCIIYLCMAMGRLLADFIQATAAALPAQSRSAVQAILHGEKTGLTLKDMGGAYYCVCGNLAPSARSEWGCPATTGHLGHINVVRPRLVDTGDYSLVC